MLQYLSTAHSVLLAISTVIWISGNGLLPLLPVYAANLGADNAQIGMYLAFAYACLALGAILSSRLMRSNKQALQLLIATGWMSFPCTLLLGYVTDLVQLMALTAWIWCLGGAGFSALNVLYGNLSSGDARDKNTALYREKRLGLLAATSPLGSVIGGAFSGPIVDYWGFEQLFICLAWLNLLWPMSASWLLWRRSNYIDAQNSAYQKDTIRSLSSPVSVQAQARSRSNQGKLLSATSLSYFSYYLALLAMAILMKDAGYSATAIASTAVVGGLVSLPLVFGMVVISGLLGRKTAWLLSNLAGALSLVCLIFASSLYYFWFVAVMIRCLSAGSRGISTSWVLDLAAQPASSTVSGSLTHQTLPDAVATNKALSLLSATPWLGGIFGYLGFGLISLSGSDSLAILVAMAAPLLSIALVLSIQSTASEPLIQFTHTTQENRGKL